MLIAGSLLTQNEAFKKDYLCVNLTVLYLTNVK